jgi:hypothetical protein
MHIKRAAIFAQGVGCAALLAFGSHQAIAALGADSASVADDVHSLRGSVDSENHGEYSVTVIRSDNGLRVREFVSPSGTVFAVTWSGPVEPDLRGLLGATFSAYTQALAQMRQAGLRRSLHLVLPAAVVDNGGHLRAFAGRAYLPALLPAGLSPTEIH